MSSAPLEAERDDTVVGVAVVVVAVVVGVVVDDDDDDSNVVVVVVVDKDVVVVVVAVDGDGVVGWDFFEADGVVKPEDDVTSLRAVVVEIVAAFDFADEKPAKTDLRSILAGTRTSVSFWSLVGWVPALPGPDCISTLCSISEMWVQLRKLKI